jgi:hypothetical protein
MHAFLRVNDIPYTVNSTLTEYSSPTGIPLLFDWLTLGNQLTRVYLFATGSLPFVGLADNQELLGFDAFLAYARKKVGRRYWSMFEIVLCICPYVCMYVCMYVFTTCIHLPMFSHTCPQGKGVDAWMSTAQHSDARAYMSLITSAIIPAIVRCADVFLSILCL